MPPKDLQPKNNKRGGQDRTAKHYPKGSEGLIPARREPGQLLLDEIQLVHDLGEVIASLGGLAEGEALGVEVGHTALTGSGLASTFLPSGPQDTLVLQRRRPGS